MRLGDLTVHTRNHTGEKPFACKKCDKSFKQRPHLKAHKNFHSGEKPFDCIDCGKKFRQSSHLKIHKDMHVKESSISNMMPYCQTPRQQVQE